MVSELEVQEIGANMVGAVAANHASQVNEITLLCHAWQLHSCPAAHDLWLRAHQLSQLRTAKAEAADESHRLLMKVIDMDPGPACGHDVLAQIQSTLRIVRLGHPAQASDLALSFRNAQRAVARDPYGSCCHIRMAWNWLIAKSAERAKSPFRLAVDLTPMMRNR